MNVVGYMPYKHRDQDVIWGWECVTNGGKLLAFVKVRCVRDDDVDLSERRSGDIMGRAREILGVENDTWFDGTWTQVKVVRWWVVLMEHSAAVISVLGRQRIGCEAKRDLDPCGFLQCVHLWHCCQFQKFSESLIIVNLLTYWVCQVHIFNHSRMKLLSY